MAWEQADAGVRPGPAISEQSWHQQGDPAAILPWAASSQAIPSLSRLLVLPPGNCSWSTDFVRADSILQPVRRHTETPAPSCGLSLVFCAGNHPGLPMKVFFLMLFPPLHKSVHSLVQQTVKLYGNASTSIKLTLVGGFFLTVLLLLFFYNHFSHQVWDAKQLI